jgi:hypothetical protein
MQSQKRMFVIVMAVMVVLATATLVAAKDDPMGIAQKQEITFTGATVVGGSLLPAGDYTVLHVMQGTTHIMIFKQINGKAEAKAKCNLVPLTEKAKTTEQRYTENAKNERVLLEMTFRGDSAKHVLEP